LAQKASPKLITNLKSDDVPKVLAMVLDPGIKRERGVIGHFMGVLNQADSAVIDL
jgi:hypothetical protein